MRRGYRTRQSSFAFICQLSLGDTMENKKDVVRIVLTESQKQQIRDALGKELDSIELQAEQLEERIAPARMRGIRI